MSDKAKLFPHYQVVRIDKETGQYYLTQYLYAEVPDFGKQTPAVRLCKEYPPIMLPLAENKKKK